MGVDNYFTIGKSRLQSTLMLNFIVKILCQHKDTTIFLNILLFFIFLSKYFILYLYRDSKYIHFEHIITSVCQHKRNMDIYAYM